MSQSNACSMNSRRSAVVSNDSIVSLDHTYEEIDGGGGDEPIYEVIPGEEADDLYEELEAVLADLDAILEEADAEGMAEEEKEAIVEFVEAKKKSKYLFDGTNMIRIRPKKSMSIKAAIGKAIVMHHKFKERRQAKEEGRFVGTVADFVGKSGPRVPPLLYYCINEIEARECTVNGIYRMPGCPETIKKLKKKFLRGKVPDVSLVGGGNFIFSLEFVSNGDYFS